MEQIIAYKPCCCNKAYMTKTGATRHEKTCYKNPNNRACITCRNFINVDCSNMESFWTEYHCEKGVDLIEYGLRHNCDSWEEKQK